jgi:hypothetical protein
MIHPTCFKRGRGTPWGKKSPSEDGDGEISPPSKLTGTGIFLPCGDGYGKITPDGEIPIAISAQEYSLSAPFFFVDAAPRKINQIV